MKSRAIVAQTISLLCRSTRIVNQDDVTLRVTGLPIRDLKVIFLCVLW